MADKVLIITVIRSTSEKAVDEKEPPVLAKYLQEGYSVYNVKDISPPQATGISRVLIELRQ
jgi:hypothetical protein